MTFQQVVDKIKNKFILHAIVNDLHAYVKIVNNTIVCFYSKNYRESVLESDHPSLQQGDLILTSIVTPIPTVNAILFQSDKGREYRVEFLASVSMRERA